MFTRSEIEKFVTEIWESDEQEIDLEFWLAKRLTKYSPSLSDLQINDILDEVIGKVKSRLRKKIRYLKEKGTMPLYEFSDILTDTLIRSKDISFADLRKIKLAIKNMSWIKFQHLCKYLLEARGVDEVDVTGGSKEGGIDFYGLLRLDKYISGVLLKGLEMRLIGQARHHSTHAKVGETALKVFAQECDDFKNGTGRGTQVLLERSERFVHSKSPVIGMFITNTGFTKGAYDLAERKGIILRDGDQIAEDLVRSSKVNEWLST